METSSVPETGTFLYITGGYGGNIPTTCMTFQQAVPPDRLEYLPITGAPDIVEAGNDAQLTRHHSLSVLV